MRFQCVLCWICLSLVMSRPLSADERLRIIAIGDSITQGGVRGRPEYTYRLPLQRILHERGIAFEFVGARKQGVHRSASWPEVAPGVPFDAKHHGFYGGKTMEVARELREVLPQLDAPDVALIHLGTNDQSSNDLQTSLLNPLQDIIELLRGKNPEVIILVAHLNLNQGPALKIRPLVEEMVASEHTRQSPVRAVHMYRGWNENPNHPQTDTFDWLHPNPRGQEKMAKAWMGVLEELMGW